jgi:hypothetical protein
MDPAFSRLDGIISLKSSEHEIVKFKFTLQMSLGSVPIAEIEFDASWCHELVLILMALQHLYVNLPRVLDEICELIQAVKKNLLSLSSASWRGFRMSPLPDRH